MGYTGKIDFVAYHLVMAEAARELRPLYKKLLRLAQSLPEPKRQTSLDQIRREFRSHGDLRDPKECVINLRSSAFLCPGTNCLLLLQGVGADPARAVVARLLENRHASRRLQWVPLPPSSSSSLSSDTLCTSDTGVQRFIYRNGQRVNAAEFEAKGEENARYKTQDIEAGLKRHHQLLRRQHFMDRKSGPPRPIF